MFLRQFYLCKSFIDVNAITLLLGQIWADLIHDR